MHITVARFQQGFPFNYQFFLYILNWKNYSKTSRHFWAIFACDFHGQVNFKKTFPIIGRIFGQLATMMKRKERLKDNCDNPNNNFVCFSTTLLRKILLAIKMPFIATKISLSYLNLFLYIKYIFNLTWSFFISCALDYAYRKLNLAKRGQ